MIGLFLPNGQSNDISTFLDYQFHLIMWLIAIDPHCKQSQLYVYFLGEDSRITWDGVISAILYSTTAIINHNHDHDKVAFRLNRGSIFFYIIDSL